ncbi:hypothetical protein E2562_019661 [Oryza meyeriana var. granulata]|uniref:Uncharacterized protein n=1 Tax=Oryza meyeriana var. granulata TaxID=110450 RepID=A0A6G1C6S0_9ORYZ|nr:hypothetical protein E2562_019661 [Oryza meyeriana var. granulata]
MNAFPLLYSSLRVTDQRRWLGQSSGRATSSPQRSWKVEATAKERLTLVHRDCRASPASERKVKKRKRKGG